jgi:hypothetical protein
MWDRASFERVASFMQRSVAAPIEGMIVGRPRGAVQDRLVREKGWIEP